MEKHAMKNVNKRSTSTNRRRIGNLCPPDLLSKMGCIISLNRRKWAGWNSLRRAAIRDLAGVLNGLPQALEHALKIRL